MICKKCGSQIPDGNINCTCCGGSIYEPESINSAPQNRNVPKCTCCGNVGPWKVGPLLTMKHVIIGILLMFLGFIPGLVYLGITIMMRLGEKNREKTCPKCGAVNLFTFYY